MKRGLRCWSFLFGFPLLLINASTAAVAADYVPILSFDRSHEVARMFRTDGAPLSTEVLSVDRKMCVSDRTTVTDAMVTRLQSLSNTDRDAAALELLRTIALCMAKRGWRTEIIEGSETQPDRTSRAVVDTVLENLSRSLPAGMDEFSDLIRVHREGKVVVYTVKARATARATIADMRRFMITDPRTAKSLNRNLMKTRVCEPQPHTFIRDGYSIAYVMLDDQGDLIWREEMSAKDCNN
jgi:hypothetical protein